MKFSKIIYQKINCRFFKNLMQMCFSWFAFSFVVRNNIYSDDTFEIIIICREIQLVNDSDMTQIALNV